MRDVEFNKSQVVKYLVWTFALAYILQICVAPLYNMNRLAGQLLLSAMMFVPAFAVLLSGAKLNGMG